MSEDLADVGYSAVTGKSQDDLASVLMRNAAQAVPATDTLQSVTPGEERGRDPRLSNTRASASHNSPAYRLRPDARYRARLAHHLYTVELMTLAEISRELGVTTARVQQYVQLVEPGFSGHRLRRIRAQGESA